MTTQEQQLVVRIRERVEAGDLPEVDVYTCACGQWIVAIVSTEDVRCGCGKTPTWRTTARRPVTPDPSQEP